MNIMNMAMQFLGPMVANKAASMLGINNTIATKLISAALPSIMGMLVGKSSSASGAGALLDMLRSDRVGDPSGIGDILESGSGMDFANAGGGMLQDLLGGEALGGLAATLGKYGDVGEAEAGSLLGLVGPVALGSLQGQVTEQNMDAAGLASFLDGQKANIASSVPADFAPQLNASGLLDGVDLPALGGITGAAATAMDDAREKVGEMAETAASYAPDVSAPEMPKSGGMLKWIIGAIVVLALGWYFLGGSTPDVAEMTSGIDMSVDGVNVGEEFGGVVDSIKTTVGGITDGASAEAALPQLEGINTKLDEIGGLAGNLPEAAKGPFASIVNGAIETIKPMIDSAIESSGAGAILQPVADSMMEKLAGLAG